MAREAIKETVKEVFGGQEGLKSFIHSSLQTLLQELVNKLMITEREIFLKQNEDVGNGFYPRGMETSLGKLALQVPRSRNSNFRSFLLPQPYKRTEESYDRLLESLLINGYSPNALRATLNSLGLVFSQKEIDVITEELKTRYYELIQKELPEDGFVLYIDAYRGEMKDKEKRKVKTVTIYTVIGISCEWEKTLYGFYIHQGVEKKEGWLKIFNDLISRGLKKVSLIVSDDFSGLKEAVGELFPHTDHQLCLTHFKRNITRNMSREEGKVFKERFTNLKISDTFDQALKDFGCLLLDYKDKYRSFMSHIWLNRENYLIFLRYPESIRQYIYTTNTSENFHRRIEKIRDRMGGFFQSEEVLGINVVLQLDRLKEGKWKNPNPLFKAHEYELLQIHRLKFKDFDVTLNAELKKAENEMDAAFKKDKSHSMDIRV